MGRRRPSPPESRRCSEPTGPKDGRIIIGGVDGLQQVPATGGEVAELAVPPDGRRALYPQLLPGGQAVLYTATVNEQDPEGGAEDSISCEAPTSAFCRA